MSADHHHHHDAEPESGSAVVADASLALDIGPGYGALIMYPSERYRGTEIEIERDGDRVHTGVHERATAAGVTRLTAVFGSLRSGEYRVCAGGEPVVEVPEDGIAEIELR